MADSEKTGDPLSTLKITTRGDIAAAGLGLAAGFFLDSWHSMLGILPGTFAVYGAAAAVGVKNALQSWADIIRTNRHQANNAVTANKEISERYRTLIEYVESLQSEDRYRRDTLKPQILESLRGEFDLFEKKWITTDQLSESFDSNLKIVREGFMTPRAK